MRNNLIKIALGSLALILGALVYILIRPSSNIYFITALNLNEFNLNLSYVPAWLYSVSTGLHTFSMVLFSSIFVNATRFNDLLLVLSWILINVFFEAIQHPDIKDLLYYELIHTDSLGYFIDNLSKGTYDSLDILSIIISGIISYFVLLILRKKD